MIFTIIWILFVIAATVFAIIELVIDHKLQRYQSTYHPSYNKPKTHTIPGKMNKLRLNMAIPLGVDDDFIIMTRARRQIKKKPKAFLEPKLSRAIEKILSKDSDKKPEYSNPR